MVHVHAMLGEATGNCHKLIKNVINFDITIHRKI